MPLADKYRPLTIDEVVGQKHLIGENKVLSNIINKKFLPNLIFFGPPGLGKTTVAEILSRESNKTFYKINASNSSTEEIKKVIKEIGKLGNEDGILLYIDEIQSFNKKQQQSILEFIENGQITLVASTTENPYHYIYKAILSRSIVMEFKPLDKADIKNGLENIIDKYSKDSFSKLNVSKEALDMIAYSSGGDMRSAINTLELAISCSAMDLDGSMLIDKGVVENLNIATSFNFDTNGDVHYNLLSAFQKSIRGSDPDAAVYYLAMLLKGGDLISICRRLLVIASEDIGMAFPNAITIVKSCTDAAMQLGMPEARIPLAQACILLATSPKSNSAYVAINKAMEDVENKVAEDVPNILKSAAYSGAKKLDYGIGYKYPHSYTNHYIKQTYLPDAIKDRIYYSPQENKFERSIKEYFDKIGASKE